MDLQRDYPAFRTLLKRLCETMGKLFTDELLESWWKALRHCDLFHVERRVDAFLAKAAPETKFPRPSQMRDPEDVPGETPDQDYRRGYWRGCIIAGIAHESGHTHASLEPVITANRDTLGRSMLDLLNDLGGCETSDEASHWRCAAKCREIVVHSAALKPAPMPL